MPVYLHGELGSRLPPMRLVSRSTQEYAGACPFCGGDERRSDRFHVWLMPAGRERFWCRRCDRKGLTRELLGRPPHQRTVNETDRAIRPSGSLPQARHIPQYRRLYALVASWAEQQLVSPWNPEPLAYLRRRGFDDEQRSWARLGYALRDPDSLVELISRQAPALLPYAEEAGLLVRRPDGGLEAHRNLRGRIVIPYQSRGAVIDLRTRRFPGHGYTSLAGSYTWRGAVAPLCWDEARGSEIVIITEGELKALAVTAAFRRSLLPAPALGHPGITYFRPEWASDLVRHGTRIAILAYDARKTRPRDDRGLEQLAPEEIWTMRHGQTLAAAGLQTLVLHLPLAPGADKEDLDGFMLRAGPQALADLLHTAAIPLAAFVNRLPPHLRLPLHP